MTAVSGAALTAAQWNTHVRDNLLETGPAKATTAGRILVTAGANSIVERVVDTATITTSQTTSSTSYTDLATVGPSVTVTTGTRALVWFSVQASNSSANSVTQTGVDISGATTSAASSNIDLHFDGLGADQALRASCVHLYTTLTPGSNTFKMQYRVGSNTGSFFDRNIGVMAL